MVSTSNSFVPKNLLPFVIASMRGRKERDEGMEESTWRRRASILAPQHITVSSEKIIAENGGLVHLRRTIDGEDDRQWESPVQLPLCLKTGCCMRWPQRVTRMEVFKMYTTREHTLGWEVIKIA